MYLFTLEQILIVLLGFLLLWWNAMTKTIWEERDCFVNIPNNSPSLKEGRQALKPGKKRQAETDAETM